MFNNVPHWSKDEVEQAVLHFDMKDFCDAGKRGRKRIRIMVLCCIYYDMDVGEEYPLPTICDRLVSRDVNGVNAMNLSTQRIGYFMSLFNKKGILDKRTDKTTRYYRRLV